MTPRNVYFVYFRKSRYQAPITAPVYSGCQRQEGGFPIATIEADDVAAAIVGHMRYALAACLKFRREA
jgi:hypothetical protein